jgi:hypothetical protein
MKKNLKSYLVQYRLEKSRNVINPAHWRTVQSEDHTGACITGLDGMGVVKEQQGKTIYGYVGEKTDRNTYPNGNPIVVHEFTLKIGKEKEV